MTIQEAIGILREISERGSMIDDKGDKEALQLGIEALKIVKWNRTHKYPSNALILRGETEE